MADRFVKGTLILTAAGLMVKNPRFRKPDLFVPPVGRGRNRTLSTRLSLI